MPFLRALALLATASILAGCVSAPDLEQMKQIPERIARAGPDIDLPDASDGNRGPDTVPDAIEADTDTAAAADAAGAEAEAEAGTIAEPADEASAVPPADSPESAASRDGATGSDTDEAVAAQDEAVPGVVSERVRQERRDAFNPYVLTAHKHNFMLPVTYSTGINEEVYRANDVPLREGLQQAEVKFQISLKSQLNERDLLLQDDALYLGITLEAWWQLYSSDLSSPFRETNYQPELFYLKPLLWGPFGGSTSLVLGLEHQSNGQVQGLSRSWNRLYASLIYERGNLVASIRPWYRLPEKEKKEEGDAEGDDNPDILDFMGHGQIAVSWRDTRFEYALRARGNPATGKGALTLGMTFPFYGKFRGFVQYFNGYGDSLIDYDHFQQQLGIGVALTSLF